MKFGQKYWSEKVPIPSLIPPELKAHIFPLLTSDLVKFGNRDGILLVSFSPAQAHSRPPPPLPQAHIFFLLTSGLVVWEFSWNMLLLPLSTPTPNLGLYFPFVDFRSGEVWKYRWIIPGPRELLLVFKFCVVPSQPWKLLPLPDQRDQVITLQYRRWTSHTW